MTFNATIYLSPHDSVVVKLNSFTPSEIENVLMCDVSVTLSLSLTDKSIAIYYRANDKEPYTLKKFNLPKDLTILESFNCSEINDACIHLATNFVIKEVGFGSTANSKVTISLDYYSGTTVDKFMKTANDKFEKLYGNGYTIEQRCYEESGIPFVPQTLEGFHDSEKIIFVGPKQSSYLHATMAQLLSKVDLGFEDNNIFKTKRERTSSTLFLDKLYEKLSSEQPLLTAMNAEIEKWDNEKKEKWKDAVNSCVHELAILNRCIASAVHHSESVRRLIINEVVKKVLDFNNGTFYVEEQQNKAPPAKTEEKFLGWGPLDFTLYTDVVLNVFTDSHDEAIVEYSTSTAKKARDISVHTSTSEEYDSHDEDQQPSLRTPRFNCGSNGQQEQVLSTDVNSPTAQTSVQETVQEAKTELSDRSLAQAGCQGHDRLIGNPALQLVAIILCTGHIWKHFVMFRRGPLVKPLLVYCGEVSMRVLRVSFKKVVIAADKAQTKKRPSGCFEDETYINAADVEQVMLALHCSVNHLIAKVKV